MKNETMVTHIRHTADERTKPGCLLYKWLAAHIGEIQMAYKNQRSVELQRHAVHLWRLILNCVGPLAAECRGKDYGEHFFALADEARNLATSGETPPEIVLLIRRQEMANTPRAKRLPS